MARISEYGRRRLQAIGRTCHSSLSQSFSQAEMIFLSTGTPQLTSLVSLLACKVEQGQMIPIGRYQCLSGRTFFNVLTKASHWEK